MTQQSKYSIVVVGLGAQGAATTDILIDLGHDVVAAVDIGDKVGKPLSTFTKAEKTPDIAVQGSIEEALNSLDQKPDIVAIMAALPVEPLVELAGTVLDSGINVVTIQPDVFGPDASWTTSLNERAVAGGASFLATGVQDTWWVQLPTLIASSSVNVTKIQIVSVLSLEQLSATIGDWFGVGQSPDVFSEAAKHVLEHPATLGVPLLECARRMGDTGAEFARDVEPIVAEDNYEWKSAGKTVPKGTTVGMRESVSFTSGNGIVFEGILEIQPIAEAATADELHVIGLPEHHLRYSPFRGFDITNLGLVARVPDVVNAAPGVWFSADLPAASHQFARV